VNILDARTRLLEPNHQNGLVTSLDDWIDEEQSDVQSVHALNSAVVVANSTVVRQVLRHRLIDAHVQLEMISPRAHHLPLKQQDLHVR